MQRCLRLRPADEIQKQHGVRHVLGALDHHPRRDGVEALAIFHVDRIAAEDQRAEAAGPAIEHIDLAVLQQLLRRALGADVPPDLDVRLDLIEAGEGTVDVQRV